ncbi:trypsin-like serine peptidase [Nannocystis pusilla]|uniref:trypsin-like serine peptidase n=1 Tax=Nannocystis pusilla TaxID=889268 RepID=UPI003BF198D6
MTEATEWFAGRIPRDLVRGVRDVQMLVDVLKDRAIANAAFDVARKATADEEAAAAALATAHEAAKLIAERGPAAQLEPKHVAALELFILLVARPALFVRGGRVMGRPDNWKEIRDDSDLIPLVTAGVGRIQSAAGDKLGTGFIAGDRRILTNNHVVCALLGKQLAYWEDCPAQFAAACDAANCAWADAAKRPVFELVGELVEANEQATSNATQIMRVVAHHPQVDMAVLELADMPPNSRRVPLATAEPDVFVQRRIYAVGYPVDDVRDAWQKRITPAPIFQRVFGADDTSLGTKRLSPGLVMQWDGEHRFLHDCSTLPGSSGSCIVDFQTRLVVGLHFAGSYYHRRNYAVPVWKFQADPLIADSGVVFGEE